MLPPLSEAALRARQRPDGTFALAAAGGEPEVEATAWAALTLALPPAAEIDSARQAGRALELLQRSDGRLSVAPPHPGNYWPTAVAALAWTALGSAVTARERALDFLEAHRGHSWPRPADWPLTHDPTLIGWPWVDGTSSWVEPTAFALLALESGGRGDGERAMQARRLLLDRQIPSGGWNYGNPSAFGRELLPTPESTGVALAALAAQTPRSAVAASLAYLHRELPAITTPLALAWATLALAAYGERPADAEVRLAECASRDPAPAESYDTVELALLLLARAAPRGLSAALSRAGKGLRG